MNQAINFTTAGTKRHAVAEFAKKLPIRPPPAPRTVIDPQYNRPRGWHEFCIYYLASI